MLEIGCGAYAPFARWCAEAGAKQATLQESFKMELERTRFQHQHLLEVVAVEGNSWAATRAACLTPDTVQANGARGGVGEWFEQDVGSCSSADSVRWQHTLSVPQCQVFAGLSQQLQPEELPQAPNVPLPTKKRA